MKRDETKIGTPLRDAAAGAVPEDLTSHGPALLDAAAEDFADRPPLKRESEYPARIPRVPCKLVHTSVGPVWHFEWNGMRDSRSYQPLPVLVHKRGRAVLLVEARNADA